MPRPTGSIATPSYCLHKPSGRAYVSVNGRMVYLGAHGSAESRQAYDRIIGEWLVSGRAAVPGAPAGAAVTVSALIAAFWEHAVRYYAGAPCPEGKRPPGELGSFRDALRPLRRLYGPTPAAEFGPRALRVMQEEFIRLGWCRNVVNRQVSRIRQVFKWGVAAEILPPHQYHGLATVRGLRRGRDGARESEPVRPVSDAAVDAVRPYVSRQVWAMIELQRLTGMRPGEVCSICTGDVDTSGANWIYRPAAHKTAYLGYARQILIGPRAQQILRPWLKTELAAFVFSPAEADRERQEMRRAARQTPMTPSQRSRQLAAARRRRQRPPRNAYTVASYRRAIARGCEVVFGMDAHLTSAERKTWRLAYAWHPHQLRHSAATKIRREFGLDAAQVILGHRTLSTTQVYAAQDYAKAAEVMFRLG